MLHKLIRPTKIWSRTRPLARALGLALAFALLIPGQAKSLTFVNLMEDVPPIERAANKMLLAGAADITVYWSDSKSADGSGWSSTIFKAQTNFNLARQEIYKRLREKRQVTIGWKRLHNRPRE